MTNLANPDRVRKLLRLKASDISNEGLESYVEDANTIVFEDVAVEERVEVLRGDIDGTNNTFTTRHPYIADTDFDCSNSTADVEVYAWGETNELDTRVRWDVSSINATKGKIYLNSVPPSTYDVITCNYHRYKNYPNWSVLKRVANLRAAYDFVFAEYLLIPSSQRHGAISWRHTKPYNDLWVLYRRELNKFNKRLTSKTKTKHIRMKEDYLDEY